MEPQLEEIVGKAVMEAETVASFSKPNNLPTFGSLSKSGRGDDIQTIKFCHIQVTTVYSRHTVGLLKTWMHYCAVAITKKKKDCEAILLFRRR